MRNTAAILLEVIREHNLEVVNFSDKCEGEWTHVIRTTGQASRLDYVLASEKVESRKIFIWQKSEFTI